MGTYYITFWRHCVTCSIKALGNDLQAGKPQSNNLYVGEWVVLDIIGLEAFSGRVSDARWPVARTTLTGKRPERPASV